MFFPNVFFSFVSALFSKTLIVFCDVLQLHALSSGLKAYCTAVAAAGIEILRMACGGHGYSLASGFTKIYVNAVAACTYEGENNVMILQTARFVFRAFALSCMQSYQLSKFKLNH